MDASRVRFRSRRFGLITLAAALTLSAAPAAGAFASTPPDRTVVAPTGLQVPSPASFMDYTDDA